MMSRVTQYALELIFLAVAYMAFLVASAFFFQNKLLAASTLVVVIALAFWRCHAYIESPEE